MSIDTDSGLAVCQLLKLHAAGTIDDALFRQLTKAVGGFNEELPIVLDGAESSTAPPAIPRAPEQPQVAAPAAATEQPADVPPGSLFFREESDGGGHEDNGDDDSDEDSCSSDEEQAQEQTELEMEPAQKKQRGSIFAFVTKRADQESTLPAELQDLFGKRKQEAALVGRERKMATLAKSRKVGRGNSTKKNGGRKNDVSAQTAKKRIGEHPGHKLQFVGGQVWCGLCKCNIGSGKQTVDKHVLASKKHLAAMKAADAGVEQAAAAATERAITEYKGILAAEDVRAKGLEGVPRAAQLLRAETLEEILTAGIEVSKIDKLRSWIERRMGFQLTRSDALMNEYLPPLRIKELNTLRSEFSGDDVFIGMYHDGTTHNGESFAQVPTLTSNPNPNL